MTPKIGDHGVGPCGLIVSVKRLELFFTSTTILQIDPKQKLLIAFHFPLGFHSWGSPKGRHDLHVPVLTSQKFCSVSGGNIIMHIFFIQERGGHFVFHNDPLTVCLIFSIFGRAFCFL